MSDQDDISFSFLDNFSFDLNESIVQYMLYTKTKHKSSLRSAISLAINSYTFLLLHILKSKGMPYAKANGHTLDLEAGLLNFPHEDPIFHIGAIKNLKELRNKFTHQEVVVSVDDALYDLDKFFFSILCFGSTHGVEVSSMVSRECNTFMIARSEYYKQEIIDEAIFINKDNYQEIGFHIGQCPFCKTDDSFGLISEDSYKCVVCNESEGLFHCEECNSIYPMTEMYDFTGNNDRYCKECYTHHSSKFE